MIFPQDEPVYSPPHLRALAVLYRAIKRYWPDWCAIDPGIAPDLYSSAMLKRGNWLFDFIFPPFFKKIRFEVADETELTRAGREGTVVYVTRGAGQLEYNYFAHLFKEVGLPPSSFANDISFRRWMPWKEYKATLITQIEKMEKDGGIPNPVSSGWLTELIISGQSALLSLRGTELEDESILLSYSQKLLKAVIAAQRSGSRPVFLVPLEFVWDRRPSHATRTVIDILFGEKENPGRIRKIVLFWRNYGHRAVAKVGEPIDLGKFLGEDEKTSDEEQTRRLGRKIHESSRMERRTVTGPLVRSKSWFVERALADDAFQQQICELAALIHEPADDLRDLAKKYLGEIAADINYTYIEIGSLILKGVFRSLFSGLIFNEEGLAHAKRLYAKAPVVFVPNHKSHADYLILSHILYNNNMTIPHVAAGLNLSFWPLGPLFRRCGAYFIRRSFENNALYKASVETYLKVLLEEGYSQEFFIEGGRSRTGKMGLPRHGLLSMLSKPVREGSIEDLHFIPVSLTYDRVLEQGSYEDELEGAQKEREKPSHLLRLVKYLKRQKGRYGKIYVNFGAPVSYAEVAKEGAEGNVVDNVAQRICREVNRNIVVTPQSIVAMALLSSGPKPLKFEEIEKISDLYLKWLRAKGAKLSLSIETDQNTALRTALGSLVLNHYVSKNMGTGEALYVVDADKRLKLDYIKNGSVHFLASIGVAAILLLKNKDIKEEFVALRDLLKFEFRFSTSGTLDEHIRKIKGFLEGCGEDELKLFANIIGHYFESLKIAFLTVRTQKVAKEDEKDLVKAMMATGRNMLAQGHIMHAEAISRANFENALKLMRDLKILRDHSGEMGTKGRKIFSSTPNVALLTKLQVQLERLI